MERCKGCGIQLQHIDDNKVGYILKEGQEYCQRCFRLRNYNDNKNLYSKLVDNKKIIELINDIKCNNIALVLDILDFLFVDNKELFNNFKKQKIILILNKLDLLSKNTSEIKFMNLIEDRINKLRNDYPNIISCLLTSIYDDKFRSFLFDNLNDLNIKDIIFVGKSNAGKSSILNKLNENNNLTVSPYLGTTLAINKIEIDNYIFYDSPGIIDNDNIINYLPNDKINDVMPKKSFKIKNYQYYERQSYFIEALLRIDVLDEIEGNISFYLNDMLKIHRSKLENGDKYLINNKKNIKYKVDLDKTIEIYDENDLMIFINGLGIIKLSGGAKYLIHHYNKVNIYMSEVLF